MRSQRIGGVLAGLAAGGVLAAAVTVVGFAPAESAERIAAPAPTPVTAPTTVIPPTAVTPTVAPPTTVVAAPLVDTSPAPSPEVGPTPAPARSSKTRSPTPTPTCTHASCRETRSHAGPDTVADEVRPTDEIPEEDVCDREWLPAPLVRTETTGCDDGASLPVSPEDLADVLDDLDVLPE